MCFSFLRGYRDSGTSFDVVILDQPKFAESQAQLHRAARGYKDHQLVGHSPAQTGRMAGHFFMFRLAGGRAAAKNRCRCRALDAGRQLQIVQRLFQVAITRPWQFP